MTQDSSSSAPKTPNARSASVTRGPNRAAARSYLRAAGMLDPVDLADEAAEPALEVESPGEDA